MPPPPSGALLSAAALALSQPGWRRMKRERESIPAVGRLGGAGEGAGRVRAERN